MARLFFFIAVIICLLGCVRVQPHCTDMDRGEMELHFSTKSPYRAVANLDSTPPNFPGCLPQRMWAIVRHGTRNPSNKVIKAAKRDLTLLKDRILNNSNSQMCPEDLARLRSWYFNVSGKENKFLVAEGEDELIELAERSQNRFPQLLPTQYDQQLFFFKYTKTQRTLKSAESFATGLFGRHHIAEIIYPEALHKDPVLRVGYFHWAICIDPFQTECNSAGWRGREFDLMCNFQQGYVQFL